MVNNVGADQNEGQKRAAVAVHRKSHASAKSSKGFDSHSQAMLDSSASARRHLQNVDLPEPLKNRLQKVVASSRVAHLWVFISPVCDGATIIARAFLLDWLGTSSDQSVDPDLLELKTNGKVGLHSIANIRHMLEQLSLSPHGKKGRAILIEAADRMLPPTANALLKALEEPPPSTVIILTSSSPHLLLPTILSRAQTLRFPGASTHDDEALEPILSLLQRGTPVAYSSIVSACDSIQKEFEKEQELLVKQLNEMKAETSADLSAAAKQEASSELDGDLTLWSHNKAKKLLEDLYLAIRNNPLQEGAAADPSHHTQLLLQAMNGIDRGSDLSSMLLWFVSQL
jgi:DNA polymerase III subunit delta'